jgi:demethylmenaquinone methyltransferase/2-methoxy-6-polyprenyl-1,4-benzoquinol methylase
LLTLDEREGSFDIISTSFVMRSIAGQMGQFFSKACDLLVPGGRLVILELTRPSNPILRLLFIPYLKLYLPLLGKLVSGDKNAYHFLSDSILHFKNRTEIVELLRQARFIKVDVKLLSGGIGTLFIAQKGQL